MNEVLTLTLVQSALDWENSQSNIDFFQSVIMDIKEATDLIILPEMFTTGFSMRARELAELPDGLSFKWMQNIANEKQSAVCGSVIVKEGDRFYNRFMFVKPDGTFSYYDKRHLFRLAGENERFTSGSRRVVVEWKGWRILPLICYDLRFPVWSRNRNDYDLIINVANWPAVRSDTWKTLLKARAIENQSFIVGVNRIGTDGMGYKYSGDSGLYSPYGVELSEIKPDNQEVLTIKISKKDLQDCRNKYPFFKDADDFEISGL
ncbi:MAG: hypothetical protein A2275_11630 [Bacteroidetes bacterium RIFOXYA12_FULL_35_11]|nr:MAG: hypothetical protein A2X01_04370 [Bacteroidetes bacterium GWF2_35_48]OFY78382.1 MAG: hypothetical protein A2275_11630 [Bacteroidetes bacterium RIFOXYA12_FULL_35_11]HBX51586.1 amidohydrolase [Bacteroidales bacterium]